MRLRWRGSVSGKSVRVWAPRLSSRASPPRPAPGPTVARLRTSAPRARARQAGRGTGRRRVAACRERLGRPQDAGVQGHRALQRPAAAAGRRVLRPLGPVGRAQHAVPPMPRPTADATRTPRRQCPSCRAPSAWRRWPPGPDTPASMASTAPRPEHHALEQRVRRQPVGAVHAGARRLAGAPRGRAASDAPWRSVTMPPHV